RCKLQRHSGTLSGQTRLGRRARVSLTFLRLSGHRIIKRLGALPVRGLPEGRMEPLTIVVSFDVGEQVVPGGIAGFVASLGHEFSFPSAEATFHRCIVP